MRILVVRLDGIGDALACAPLLVALRDAGHELGIALTTRNAAIFARDAQQWTHVLERRPWPAHGHAPADIVRVKDEAAAIRYDWALIASEEPDAYELGRECASQTVGFHNGWEKPLKSLRVRRMLDRPLARSASAARAREHEVVTLFRLGDGLNAEPEPTDEVARLAPLILDVGTFDRAARRSAGRYVALQLTPKWEAMGIGHHRLAEIARGLRALAPVRLLAGDFESNQVRAVGEVLDTDVSRIDATIFSGEEGMRAWKTAIADATVLVSPDTGASNLAGMVGTPCVDVFPAGRNAGATMRRWSPWAGPCELLTADDAGEIVGAAGELFEQTCARS